MRSLIDALRRLLPELPSGSRKAIVLYIVATCSLSLLDIASLGLLALILTSMMSDGAMSLPVVGTLGTDRLPTLLVLVCLLMVLKAALALVIQWFATRTFSNYELTIGDTLFRAYIRAPWETRLSRSTAQLVRLADVGVANTISGVLLPALSLPSLVATFLAVLVVLVVVNPLTALITIVYLGLVAFLLYAVISKRSIQAGEVNLRFSLAITKLMTEMVSTLKEITLRNKFDQVSDVVHANRARSTRARANLSFLGTVPPRVLEVALVGGVLLVGAVSYWQGGLSNAFTQVALFGVAGMRMIPSITGFQGTLTRVVSNIPHLNAVLRDIDASRAMMERAEKVGHDPLPEQPRSLNLHGVSYTYSQSPAPAVDKVSVTVPIGSSLGLVGASGSGKSTLVDIILGLLIPQEGTIDIDGLPLESVLSNWRSRVGYVPQEVALFDATIAQNVALTWDDDFDEARVLQALERAQLTQMVKERPGGINAVIGERGIALSGGQRQRLGIARALYADPLVLVLDEATSALDTATEEAVTAAIHELHGDVTVVQVAHRLSTIRKSDNICFMRDGHMTAQGTFEELVEREPEFAIQAGLAGLI